MKEQTEVVLAYTVVGTTFLHLLFDSSDICVCHASIIIYPALRVKPLFIVVMQGLCRTICCGYKR